MNSIFAKIRDKHALWYKGIVFIFSVIICSYLLPSSQNLSFKFIKTGEVWKNETLISEIDFLIQKTNSEIEIDKTSKATSKSYYNQEDIDTESLLSDFKFNITTQTNLKAKLDSIYSIGYCNQSIKTNGINDSIYLIKDNEAILISTSSLIDQSLIKNLLKNDLLDTIGIVNFSKKIPFNIIYNSDISNEIKLNTIDQTQIYKNKINKGEVLLYKNDIVTEEQYQILQNYIREMEMVSLGGFSCSTIIGKLMACSLILGIMMLFLAFFRKNIFSLNAHVTFIFLIIILLVVASSIVSKYNQNYISAIPFCLVPILIRVFFDSRTALFNFLNIVLLCAFFTSDKFEFVFIQLIVGIGTIFSVADMGKRSKLLISSLLTLVFYILAFVAYHLLNQSEHNLELIENYYPFIISSMCVLFAFPLIYLFEKIFGFVSDFTLLELCDLNNPLLRQLSQKIPGTFQHSLQVANLAEEACYKIGGNALLVRTGAMYHDIGKILNPRFFTENQVGEVSPHQDISSEESAKIIINHVVAGIEKAKEYKLPEAIIDFIRTHHGTTTTRFFLHNYKKEHEGKLINEDLFRYPGPIPFSKETAVLMMADSVEASSRSLKKYDAITIDDLVDRIIDHQISENQFINADITFRDINQIKKIFKKRLMNIYHVRIEYPR